MREVSEEREGREEWSKKIIEDLRNRTRSGRTTYGRMKKWKMERWKEIKCSGDGGEN